MHAKHGHALQNFIPVVPLVRGKKYPGPMHHPVSPTALANLACRDTVSLPGFAEYFRQSSLEERSHAQVGGGGRAGAARGWQRRLSRAALQARASSCRLRPARFPISSSSPFLPTLSLLQKLIDLQNTRGGRVKLGSIINPETEYEHPEKGEWELLGDTMGGVKGGSEAGG